MPRTILELPTPIASRYLEMLCRHFSRKVPSEWDASRGVVDFKPGHCEMNATAELLTILCDADDQPALDRVQSIVDSHLVRFGNREGIQLVWR